MGGWNGVEVKAKTLKDDIGKLAYDLYEGTPALQNLAEELARKHGKAQALCPFIMQSENVQNFYRTIAKMLIDHSKQWEPNQGCCCTLDPHERERLANLPRV